MDETFPTFWSHPNPTQSWFCCISCPGPLKRKKSPTLKKQLEPFVNSTTGYPATSSSTLFWQKEKTQSRHQTTGPMPKQNPSTNSFSHALLQPLENPKASKRFNKWLTAYGSVEYVASIMIASHHRSHPHRRHYTTAPKTNDRYLAVLLRCLPRCQWCCQPVELFMKEDLRKFSDTYSSQKNLHSWCFFSLFFTAVGGSLDLKLAIPTSLLCERNCQA